MFGKSVEPSDWRCLTDGVLFIKAFVQEMLVTFLDGLHKWKSMHFAPLALQVNQGNRSRTGLLTLLNLGLQ